MTGSPVRRYGGLLLPVAATLPGLALRAGLFSAPASVQVLLLGVAVIGAAFLLSWGTELAEPDLGQGIALALLALIAVLPEYAVDTVFAWKAGQDPATYAPLALANMTGANRLLIGVGWSVVALVALAVARRRAGNDPRADELVEARGVPLAPVQLVEVAFLAAASLYALTLPLRHTVTLLDTAVLFGLFGLYLWRVRQADAGGDDEGDEEEDSELYGPAARVAALPAPRRRLVAAGMLLAAAAVILAVAEPFATSLVDTGRQLHVSDFLLVQWVAPLASETPEFIAVLLLAVRLEASSALGALVSSKINQWTLLVGIIPLVFAISSAGWHGLPIDSVQREELFLTAAQSVFAVALVVGHHRLSRTGAWALLALFTAQFVFAWLLPASLRGTERLALSVVYLLLAAGLLVRRRRGLAATLDAGIRQSAPAASSSQ